MRAAIARLAPVVVPAAGAVGWLAFAFVTVRYLVLSGLHHDQQPHFIHLDWRVYAAGGHDLIERSLYRVPLELGDRPVPLETFNLPPFAALLAIPLLPMEPIGGGLVWQAVGAVGVASAAVMLGRLARLRWRQAGTAAGIGLGAFMLLEYVPYPDDMTYWWGLVLGTNNYLMLGLVAAFALAYRTRRDRSAGLLLAAAVAIKVWPIALAALLIRERRWTVGAWAAGGFMLQALVFVIGLGPDAVPAALHALGASADPDTVVIGVAAPGRVLEWWPMWLPPVVGAFLALLPVSGRAGLGLGMLGGLAAITNLWGHYLPTVIFAFGLVCLGLWHGSPQRGGDGPAVANP